MRMQYLRLHIIWTSVLQAAPQEVVNLSGVKSLNNGVSN